MTDSNAPKWQIIAAFIAIYVIWGSTYLFIAWAIETLPPFIMAAVRFLVAGGLLYGLSRWRGAPNPGFIEWQSGAVVGILLLFGGNGGVTWAEQTLPSGLAALLVATVPIWVSVVNWIRPAGIRPTRGMIAGLVIGLLGITILLNILVLSWDSSGLQISLGFEQLTSGKTIDPIGTGVILLAALSWATGTVYSRVYYTKLAPDPLMSTATQMLSGGVLLSIAAILTGELPQINVATISLKSGLSLLYLVIFGSIVAFSAYVWLLKHVNPSLAATYAYVNPVVAVFLGWALAGEDLSSSMLIAAPVIILAIILITTQQPRPKPTLILSDKETLPPSIPETAKSK
jgi:drug/metabolite transporter (DMT)-like permease